MGASYIDNPTQYLNDTRKLARGILETRETKKPLKASEILQLAERFQEIDEALSGGGEAPSQWTENNVDPLG